MASSASTDPFYLVKDDIQASLDKAQTQQGRWQSLGNTNPDKKRLGADVEDECKSIAWQVDEMEKAVDVAEKNMSRFGLSQAEISNRRKWVMQTRKKCESIMSSLEGSHKVQIYDSDNGNATKGLRAAAAQENDAHINSESDRQQLLIRQQDDELDQLGQHVERLGGLGREIHGELESQSRMLDDLDEEVEGTHHRLAAAQKKMNNVLKKMGLRGQLCLIAFLIAILVLLIVLTFS
ncbi:g792 [Coccomyxa viridis]|uniref:G792 protein n=1 Tax=Coccomyxa viridis TaxID=1274662 RepID=A0ABP1FGJ9_9CHLO